MTETNDQLQLWLSTISQQGVGRKINEDAIFSRNFTDEKYALFGVADGMGGLQNGEYASSEVGKIFSTPLPSSPENSLRDRAQKSNTHLYNKQIRQGSTVAVVAIDKTTHNFFSLSIGDSRIYHYHNNKLKQISADDKSKQYISSPNLITNAIGIQESLALPTIIKGRTSKGDIWLVSTDGLHERLNFDFIQETIQFFKKQQILNELTKATILRGSQDDISAALCCIN